VKYPLREMETSMTQAVDFFEASRRHYADATLLRGEGCDPNAGHLFGFSAECGVKALLVDCGYPTDQDGDLDRSRPPIPDARKHIAELTAVLQQLVASLSGRNGVTYLGQIPNLMDFADWKVSHRYYAAASIPPSLDRWQAAAGEVQYMLQNLQIDKGVI
jgi:hypothetical protein